MVHTPRVAHDLIEARVDALYLTDPSGRIVGANEWDRRPAPRFHLTRTLEGTLITRFRADLPTAAVAGIEDAVSRSAGVPPTPDGECGGRNAGAPGKAERAVLDLLSRCGPVERVWQGPVFAFLGDRLPASSAIAIDETNAGLLRAGFGDWIDDVPHRRPFLAVLEAEEALSICASVRITSAVHCAGVSTREEHRRKGHAADAVAGWVRAVRRLGATPFYSTSWDNIASRGVAARLGFTWLGSDFHVT